MKILVTGAAGFIGFHTARALLDRGETVVGLDNLNTYYEPALKLARLQMLEQYANFSFLELNIADRAATHLRVRSTGRTLLCLSRYDKMSITRSRFMPPQKRPMN